MSERGFFVVDRRVWDHPQFAREKFSEREAWLWMISSAAWEPCRTRVGRTLFDLERGQLVFALRFLAVKWMWSEPRVRRFLKRLINDASVLVSATREATLITICKYNDYQLSRRTDVADSDASSNEKPTDPRHKEEETKQSANQEIRADQQRKRAVRLASDAAPSERNLTDAKALGLTTPEIEQQWRRMRDWSASAPKGACLDWDARWRNWCETFLGGRNGHGFSNNRTNPRSQQSGSAAVLAGVVAATERRARERAAAGQQRQIPIDADPAETDDPELFGAGARAAAH